MGKGSLKRTKLPLPKHTSYLMGGGGHIWLGNHVPSEQMFIQTIVELPVPQCGLWCWGVQSGVMCTT